MTKTFMKIYKADVLVNVFEYETMTAKADGNPLRLLTYSRVTVLLHSYGNNRDARPTHF
jgi:hypothetical protein